MKTWGQLLDQPSDSIAFSASQHSRQIPVEFILNSPFKPNIKIDMNLVEPISKSVAYSRPLDVSPVLHTEDEWTPADLTAESSINVRYEREIFEASMRALSCRRRDANTTESLKLVEFSVEMPEAQMVKLAADFTDWDKSPLDMVRFPDGTWSTTVPLPTGIYGYRFLVDGEWYNDPRAFLRDPDSATASKSFVRVR